MQSLLQRDCPELLLASQEDFDVQIPPLGTPAKREAINLLRHLLPQLFEPATTVAGAKAASEHLRVLVNQAANEPFSKKYYVINQGKLVPAENPLKSALINEANQLGTFGFQALWSKVGLGDAYTIWAGTDNDKLLDSGMTLVQIYERLYKYVLRQNSYSNWFKAYAAETKEGRRWFSSRIAPTVVMERSDVKWANSNGLLLLWDATQLPTGQVVWNRDGSQSAIVGVDDVSKKFRWGLAQPNILRDLSGVATLYSATDPALQIEDPSCTDVPSPLRPPKSGVSAREWADKTFECRAARQR